MNLKVIVAVAAPGIVITVTLMVVMIPRTGEFRSMFMKKCQSFPESSTKCEELLNVFEKTYEGKSPSKFPETNYDPVFVAAPFTHPGEKTLLWSAKKDLPHKFTENRQCLFTLEDTLLGSVLDGETWCGLKGLKGTYTQEFCKMGTNDTVDSFWRRASTKFAQHARGTVTAMLDGDAGEPVRPGSFFRKYEVKQLVYPRVTNLDVILVTYKQGVCETDQSLQELMKTIRGKNIGYSCKEVPSAHIHKCIEDNECESCWTPPFSGFVTPDFILCTPYKTTVFYLFVYIIYSSIITN